MGLTTKEGLFMTLNALVGGKGICMELLEALRVKRGNEKYILASDFLKNRNIRSETFKRYQDVLEEMGLIKVEVLRNVTGRPNKITLTKKGESAIIKLLELQKVLSGDN